MNFLKNHTYLKQMNSNKKFNTVYQSQLLIMKDFEIF